VTNADLDPVASRLSALKAAARDKAEQAVAAEAQALIDSIPGLAVEPGDTPLERRIVASRRGSHALLRVLTVGTQAWPQRLSAALSALLGASR
jgi:hypothetical protein